MDFSVLCVIVARLACQAIDLSSPLDMRIAEHGCHLKCCLAWKQASLDAVCAVWVAWVMALMAQGLN